MFKKLLVVAIILLGAIGLAACDKEETIKVYTRDTSSGTRDGFFGAIGFNEAKKDDSVLVNGFNVANNAGIINAVKTDDFAIGYISYASRNSDVKTVKFNGVEATEANVLDGSYGLSRNFNYMLRDDYSDIANGETIQQISEAFVAYMGTTEGLIAISQEGGIVDLAGGESWNNVKENYAVCNSDNSSVTVKFGGSDSVTKIAEALSSDFSAKCGSFIPDHNHTGSSNAYKGLNGANKGESDNLSIHIGFASREFKDSEPANTKGKLATDAIVVIINKNNSVNDLTADQIKKIYEGEITDWTSL